MQTRATLPKIEILKKEISLLLPGVKSSHRVEAMARGLGWNSNATLRVDLADGPQVRTVDEARFTAYLTEHGFPGSRTAFWRPLCARRTLRRPGRPFGL